MNRTIEPVNCYQLQSFLAKQPPENEILFSYNGKLLKLYECWAEKGQYIIQLEEDLPVIQIETEKENTNVGSD